MTTNNIASGNEMIDIEGNDLDNEINNYDDSSKDHNNKNASTNDDDSSIISDDNSDNINKQTYPSDCYSFLSIYGPTKNPGKFDLIKYVSCTNYYSFAHTSLFCIWFNFSSHVLSLNSNTVYFFFGLVICLFQLAFLILFVLSVLHPNFSSKVDIDSKLF